MENCCRAKQQTELSQVNYSGLQSLLKEKPFNTNIIVPGCNKATKDSTKEIFNFRECQEKHQFSRTTPSKTSIA